MTFQMLFTLGGGLGLFLYGMKMMGDGLEKAAGNKMKRLLEVLTTNRFMGVLVGTVVTAIIQSSSATTVMIIGFVNAGLMNLAQATGVIMGANIGTTITGQLVALKVTDYAPIAVFLGVGILLFAKKRYIKHIGEILTGFGILFMGMNLMSAAMEPLHGNAAFQNIMTKISNPFLGVLVGAGMTMILQSSSASLGILQALAMQGLIGLDVAIFILFGQNIGTCITAILASIGANINAKRTAAIHLMFNVMGTALFMGLLLLIKIPYIDWIVGITPGDVVRQIANAHTGFNIINTIITFPIAGYLAFLAKKMVPGEEPKHEEMSLNFLDKRILETPPFAVAQIRKEVDRMGSLSRDNLSESIESLISMDESKINNILHKEEILNFLNRNITEYLIQVNGLEISDKDRLMVGGLFHVVNDIERIGDHAENMVEYTQYLIEHDLTMSEKALDDLRVMKDHVIALLDDSLLSMKNRDRALAGTVKDQEIVVDELEQVFRENHIERLNQQLCTPGSGVVFLDVINNLERVADHANNIARFVLD
ncbi:MAG: Na/Pi cotransporter family protein [Clostridiales bacterium]|nr:Na/Pi cotransporter family protein [Clostridiales bacterium]